MNIGSLVGVDFNVPVWLLLIIALVVTYYIYSTWHFGDLKRIGIRHDKPVFIMGTMGKLFSDGIAKHDSDIIEKYGPVAGAYQGRMPVIMTIDLDIIKQIMVKDAPNFHSRQRAAFDKKSIMAKMMSICEGDRWRNMRNTLSPTFSAGKLKLMTAAINKNAANLVKHMQRALETDGQMDFRAMAGAFTMDTIGSTAFGLDLDSQTDRQSEFMKMGEKSFNFSFKSPAMIIAIFLPFVAKYLGRIGLHIFPQDAERFFVKVSEKALEQREKNDRAADFLQLAANSMVPDPTDKSKANVYEDDIGLWTTDGLTKDEIIANAVVFFLAGYETTANSLSFAAHCLATNEHVQDRLIEEIDEQLQGREPKYGDLTEMHYLDNVISETLRLYPQAPRIQRKADSETVIEGVRIPKDMEVGICVINLHMNPQYWPEPHKFDPDRFKPEVKATRDPYCYLPFGAGPRNCIGSRLALMELKIALIRILQKYKIVPSEKTQIPLKLNKMRPQPEDGVLWLTIQPRENAKLED